MRLERAIEQERKAESCIEGIYAELYREHRDSQWLHEQVRWCYKKMEGYPRHSQSHVHGFGHGMFVSLMRFDLVYASKFPCGRLIASTKEAEELGMGPRELALKPHVSGHYWPNKHGMPDPKSPFIENIRNALLGDDEKILHGKSYVVLLTDDNDSTRWNPEISVGPMLFWSAIKHVAERDPVRPRGWKYEVKGKPAPYLYVARASDALVKEIEKGSE